MSSTTTSTDDDYRFFIRVAEDMPSLDDCYTFCAADPSCGAVSSFVGITRHDFQGRRVAKLTYEGYVPMAVKEMRALCVAALERYPSVTRIAAVHRLGDCPVGLASVILVAASPHRKDALHCTEFLIDALKARVPIWKLEVYADDPDGAVWKENIEWHEGQARRVMTKQEASSSSSS